MVSCAVKVLVVEGDAARPLTGLLAHDPGFEAAAVGRLSDALAALAQPGCDLVLLDLAVCRAGASATLQRLLAQRPDLPLIAVASGVDADDLPLVREAIAAGAQDCLAKERLESGQLRHAIIGAIERKRQEQRRLRYARQDELTGLANRQLLEERFERAVARAERQDGLLGIVALDLAHVVRLVDDQASQLGDRLICAAAERFSRLVRSTDTLARTRPRGFTWLVEGLHQVDEVNALVDRLTALIEPGFRLDHLDVRLTASAGIALYPLHGRRFGMLHDLAEAAMSDVASISGGGYLVAPWPFHAAELDRHASAA